MDSHSGFCGCGVPFLSVLPERKRKNAKKGRGKRPGPSYSCGAIGSSLRGVIAPPAFGLRGRCGGGVGSGPAARSFPPQGIKIRRRHPIRPTSRRERAKPPTLPAANHIPPRSQPPNQASSRQGRHLSWRHVALRSKRTGRRQRVRNTATDAFGRPGPGRSPGRSLPSFCRHRKKGPAGEAVEEMS